MAQKLQKTFSDINITPLTDIFLVLLIIMMVVAPMLDSKGLSIALPTVSENAMPATDAPKLLNVKVTAGNAIEIEGKTVEKATLLKTLRELAPDYAGGLVLRLHPEAAYETSIAVMDAAQAANIEKLSIQELG